MTSFLSSISVLKEGEDRPENSFPIDIVFDKLTEWLIDRKKCPLDWKQRSDELRKQGKEVVQMIEAKDSKEMADLKEICANGTPTYYHFQKIFELLKEDENNKQTDFFGRYVSTVMSSLNGVLNGFKGSNLYLIDSASIMTKIVQFDIPAIKRELTRLGKQVTDFKKKEADCDKNANKYAREFQDACQKWGIEGLNVREELGKAVERDLPIFFADITKEAQQNSENLNDAITFYRSFVEYLTENIENDDKSSTSCSSSLCSLLSFWANFGNQPLYQWDYYCENKELKEVEEEGEGGGEKEEEMISLDVDSEPTINLDLDDSQPTINLDLDDFGGFEITTEGGGEGEGDKGAELSVNFDGIDFSSFETPSELDWEVSSGSSSSAAPTIDWGSEDLQIEVVDSVSASSSSSSSSPSSSSASQNELLLQKTDTRRQILTELMELQLFLKQRMVEMKGKSSLLSSNQFQFASSVVQKQTLSSVQGFLEVVERLLGVFEGEKGRVLLELKSSGRFVERMSLDIRGKEDTASKLRMSGIELEGRRQKCSASIEQQKPVLAKAIEETKNLQKHLEKDLGSLISREVNIIGDLNNL